MKFKKGSFFILKESGMYDRIKYIADCIDISTIFEKTKNWAEKGHYQNIQTITCKNEL